MEEPNQTPIEENPSPNFKADHLFTYILPPVTGIITLYVEKNDSQARYSAYQSMLLGVLFLSAYVILAVLLPQVVEVYILTVLKLVFFTTWLYCIWRAYTGVHFELPYLGKLAHKLANQNA